MTTIVEYSTMDPAYFRVAPLARDIVESVGLDPEQNHGLLHCLDDGGHRITVFVDPDFLEMLKSANGTAAMPSEFPGLVPTGVYPGWPDDWPPLMAFDDTDDWRGNLAVIDQARKAGPNGATRRVKKRPRRGRKGRR